MSYPPKKSGTRPLPAPDTGFCRLSETVTPDSPCKLQSENRHSSLSPTKKTDSIAIRQLTSHNRNLPSGLSNMNTYKPNRHRVRADTLLFVEYGNDATETSFVVLHLRTYVLYHSPTAVSTLSRPFFTFFQPQERGSCLSPAVPRFYLSRNVAQFVSPQSHAPQPLISTCSAEHLQSVL